MLDIKYKSSFDSCQGDNVLSLWEVEDKVQHIFVGTCKGRELILLHD